nr:serine:threonine protein kinase haspin [Hymenolepis microstoma]
MPDWQDVPNETEYSCAEEVNSSQDFAGSQVSEEPANRDAILEYVELKDFFDISGQEDFKTFDDVFIEKYKNSIKMPNLGSFSTVFLCGDALKAFKVIPFSDNNVNNSDLGILTMTSIYNEIVCASKLSKLRSNQNFPKVHNIHLIKDAYPQYLRDLYENFHQRRNLNKRFDFDKFPSDQTWVIIESEMYGRSLNSVPPTCPMAALSVFAQTVLAIAVAEKRFHFEHRDLHGGNILLQYDSEDACSQKIPSTYFHGRTLQPHNGPHVKIIDFTLSRITDRDTAIFTNVSRHKSLLIGNPRPHAHIYQEMRDLLKDDWSNFNPRSNVKWVHHIGKQIHEVVEKGKYCNSHMNCEAELIQKQFRELIDKAKTARSTDAYVREISNSKILFMA